MSYGHKSIVWNWSAIKRQTWTEFVVEKEAARLPVLLFAQKDFRKDSSGLTILDVIDLKIRRIPYGYRKGRPLSATNI